MGGPRKLGIVVMALSGLACLIAVGMYFVNPFDSPILDPRARIAGYTLYRMPGASMEPALRSGAVFMVNTAQLGSRDPRPGEIAVFLYPPDPRVAYVKRVIAAGGSTVEMREGVVYVNGEPLAEPYLPSMPDLPRHARDFAATKVPETTFFVLGDNRANSEDSRVWGPVPRELFVGIFNGVAVGN